MSGVCRKVQRYPVLDGGLMLVKGKWRDNCLVTLGASSVAHIAFYGHALPHGISVDLLLMLCSAFRHRTHYAFEFWLVLFGQRNVES